MAKTNFDGSWKITKMEQWNQADVDLVVPGFVRFDGETGELQFICVRGDLSCVYTTTRGRPHVQWAWVGQDEFDPCSGSGRARIDKTGKLVGFIQIHHGDGSAFEAKKSAKRLEGYQPGPKWGGRGRWR